MRIVYSLPHPADRLAVPRAGHLVRANALLEAMESLGHEVMRVEAAAAPGSAAAARTYRGTIKRLLPRPVALRLRDLGRVVFARRAAGQLIEAVRTFRPDVILETHTPFALAGQLAAAATGVPLALDDVGPVWEEAQQYGAGLARLATSVFRRVTSQARLVVAVTDQIRAHLRDLGIPDNRVVTIENGIDARRFHGALDGRPCRAALGIAEDAIAIVYVGSFQPFHGVPSLLQAFARASLGQPSRLILVGEGRTAPECSELVERLGIGDRVLCTGRVDHDMVPALIAAADITVIPASNDYGDSMKLYEYMAVGRAVLAPRQDTMTRVVEHGRTAFLFERDAPQSLAAAITVLAERPDLRRSLGRAAAELAAGHTWERRAKLLLDAIEGGRAEGTSLRAGQPGR